MIHGESGYPDKYMDKPIDALIHFGPCEALGLTAMYFHRVQSIHQQHTVATNIARSDFVSNVQQLSRSRSRPIASLSCNQLLLPSSIPPCDNSIASQNLSSRYHGEYFTSYIESMQKTLDSIKGSFYGSIFRLPYPTALCELRIAMK